MESLTWEDLSPTLAARVQERLLGESWRRMEKTTIGNSLKWDVHAGDARLVLPDTFVADVLIVDPPYSKHVHESATSQDQHTDGGVRHNDLGFDPITTELRTWICKLAARTRRWSVIYTDIESVAAWKTELELAGATYIRTLPWVRWSSPQLSGDRPPQGFECLVVAHGSQKGKKHWNGAGNLTHLAHLALRGNGKHKTEKPLDQLLDLVSWFSDPGELVVDPCAGSGTGGVACKILGRSFMGCELDAEWVTKANDRILKCDPARLRETLSDRDLERLSRWTQATEEEKVAAGPRKANTDRVRKRMADKKLAASGTDTTQVVATQVVATETAVVSTKVMIVESDNILWTVSEDNDGAAVWELDQWLKKEADGANVYLQPPASATSAEVRQWIEVFKKRGARIAMVDPNSNWTGIPGAWTEAYQRCIADTRRALISTAVSAPKPSAAERTVPLFDPPFEDEYTAKKWREAYERCIVETEVERWRNAAEAETAARHGRDPRCTVYPPTHVMNCKCDAGLATEQTFGSADSVSTTEAEMRCQEKMGGLQCLRMAGHEENHTANPAALNDPESVSTTESELRCPACIDEPVRCEACRGFLGITSSTPLDEATTALMKAAGVPMTSSASFQSTGVIPSHVLAELGMHPALVDEPVRNRAIVRARHEGWPDNWLTLQEQAPTGFFTRVLKEMQMVSGERLSTLVEAMRARGLAVGVYDAAGWSPFQRDAARLWIEQSSERPSFFDKYQEDQAGMLGSCAACERLDDRPYTHTCEKGQSLGESKQGNLVESKQASPAPQLAAETPKRGKGRPPGVKNKAPKEWKKVYERAMVELGAS
jgi:site-specific DNA-methyltransferase (adenine-specific)